MSSSATATAAVVDLGVFYVALEALAKEHGISDKQELIGVLTPLVDSQPRERTLWTSAIRHFNGSDDHNTSQHNEVYNTRDEAEAGLAADLAEYIEDRWGHFPSGAGVKDRPNPERWTTKRLHGAVIPCIKPEYMHNLAVVEAEIQPYRIDECIVLLEWAITSVVLREGPKSQAAPALDSRDDSDMESDVELEHESGPDYEKDMEDEQASVTPVLASPDDTVREAGAAWIVAILHQGSEDKFMEILLDGFQTRAEAKAGLAGWLFERLHDEINCGSYDPTHSERWLTHGRVKRPEITQANDREQKVPGLKPQYKHDYRVMKEEWDACDQDANVFWQFRKVIVRPPQVTDPMWAHLQPVPVDVGRERIPKELINIIYQMTRIEDDDESAIEDDLVADQATDEEEPEAWG